MIRSFKHKGLREFFYHGSKKGINPAHADKLETRLDRLNASTCPEDMRLPGYRLHELGGRGPGEGNIFDQGFRSMANDVQI